MLFKWLFMHIYNRAFVYTLFKLENTIYFHFNGSVDLYSFTGDKTLFFSALSSFSSFNVSFLLSMFFFFLLTCFCFPPSYGGYLRVSVWWGVADSRLALDVCKVIVEDEPRTTGAT